MLWKKQSVFLTNDYLFDIHLCSRRQQMEWTAAVDYRLWLLPLIKANAPRPQNNCTSDAQRLYSLIEIPRAISICEDNLPTTVILQSSKGGNTVNLCYFFFSVLKSHVGVLENIRTSFWLKHWSLVDGMNAGICFVVIGKVSGSLIDCQHICVPLDFRKVFIHLTWLVAYGKSLNYLIPRIVCQNKYSYFPFG